MKEKRRRDKYIQIRVTVGERRRAKVEAKKVGVSVGRMVREMVRYITYNRKEFKRWVKSGGLAGEGESKGGSGGGQKYRRSAEV